MVSSSFQGTDFVYYSELEVCTFLAAPILHGFSVGRQFCELDLVYWFGGAAACCE